MKFSDAAFLNAIDSTEPKRGQMEKIAHRVGCSHTTALKRIRKLEDEGLVTVRKMRTYDKQEQLPGNHYFGGTGVCVRRYLTVEIFNDPTPWCHACGAMEQDQCDCLPIADNN